MGGDLRLDGGDGRSRLIRRQARMQNRHQFVFVHKASADPGLKEVDSSGKRRCHPDQAVNGQEV